MDLADFSIQNKWWKGKEYIKEDKHIRDFSEKKYKFEPEALKSIPLPGNIYTLRGPRQVGKTTLVKLLIKRLLEKDVPGKGIFYAGCDAVLNFSELLKLIRSYLEFADSNNVREKYVFLDEISGIENWQKAIKLLVDTGEAGDVCFYLTGSHTLDIKQGLELLPGRLGKHGKDHLLLPLSFREFVMLVRPEIGPKITPIEVLSIDAVNKSLGNIMPFDRELKVLFNQYLTTGGFVLAINEFYAENKIPDYVYEIYSRWVIGDVVKWGKQENILKQALRTAIIKQGTAVSWDSFAKEAEIKSHNTVSSYVEDLENMFVFFVLYFIDQNKKTADFGKNKKIYFFDPLIYHIFNKMFYSKETEITPSLIEAVAAVHFARYYGDRPSQIRHVFYWKNKRETDLVIKTDENLFAVEVKYQEKIANDDFASLYHFKEGIIASKSAFMPDKKYSVIPIHILLAMLG